MGVSALDFLAFSESLNTPAATEMHKRMAVGRGYYAAFHWARACAEKAVYPQAPESVRGSHEQVIQRYVLEGSKEARSIAYKLREMKSKRELADYELNGGEDLLPTPAVLLENVRALITRISNLTGEPAPVFPAPVVAAAGEAAEPAIS